MSAILVLWNRVESSITSYFEQFWTNYSHFGWLNVNIFQYVCRDWIERLRFSRSRKRERDFFCSCSWILMNNKRISVHVYVNEKIAISLLTDYSRIYWILTLQKHVPKELRVRAFFHKAVRVCHVYCNFKIGLTCRITVIFGTLKDWSLLINTLASNICFSYRNMFQNGVDALSKIVDAFLSKSSKFHLVRIIR